MQAFLGGHVGMTGEGSSFLSSADCCTMSMISATKSLSLEYFQKHAMLAFCRYVINGLQRKQRFLNISALAFYLCGLTALEMLAHCTQWQIAMSLIVENHGGIKTEE